LMNYFFTEYLDELFTFNQYEKGDGYLRAIDALTFFQDNKQFFINAFKSEGFNNFTDYQYQYYYDKYYALTLEIKGEITPDTDVAIKFYCSGVAFIVKDWIMSGCKMTPQEMSQLIHDFLPIQIPHHY